MAPFQLVISGLLASVVVDGLRQIRKLNSTEEKTCDDLADIVVKGHAIGETAVSVCQNWPFAGGFPLDDAVKTEKLLERLYSARGAFDELKQTKNERDANSDFCWRASHLRTVKKSGGCEVVDKGVCYGACPYGFMIRGLKGRFKPVCSSACSDSTLHVSCGFGCASSLKNCAKTAHSQVKNVAIMASHKLSEKTGNEDIAKITEGFIRVTEFLFGVFIDTVKSARKILKDDNLDIQSKGAAVLTLLFQTLKEVGNKLDIQRAQASLSSIMSFLMHFMEDEDMDEESVAAVVAGEGDNDAAATLEAITNLISAFTYPKCKPATDLVFTVDEVGDERLQGPWVQRQTHDGRPRYTVKGESYHEMKYVKDDKDWIIRVDEWFSWDEPLYRASVNSKDYPVEGWKVVGKGIAPAPVIVVTRPPRQ